MNISPPCPLSKYLALRRRSNLSVSMWDKYTYMTSSIVEMPEDSDGGNTGIIIRKMWELQAPHTNEVYLVRVNNHSFSDVDDQILAAFSCLQFKSHTVRSLDGVFWPRAAKMSWDCGVGGSWKRQTAERIELDTPRSWGRQEDEQRQGGVGREAGGTPVYTVVIRTVVNSCWWMHKRNNCTSSIGKGISVGTYVLITTWFIISVRTWYEPHTEGSFVSWSLGGGRLRQ